MESEKHSDEDTNKSRTIRKAKKIKKILFKEKKKLKQTVEESIKLQADQRMSKPAMIKRDLIKRSFMKSTDDFTINLKSSPQKATRSVNYLNRTMADDINGLEISMDERNQQVDVDDTPQPGKVNTPP